ncbi:MAG: hypothetical protein LC112_14030 [Flavobacteriales bacterium]|nr:hypothetical protein [Flavobacteriales bacterium]
MIGCNVKGYAPSCSAIVGGVGNLYIGDANDFDFTEGAPDANGDPTGYATIAYRPGATAAGGAYLYEIKSVIDSIMVDISQSNPESTSSEYAYEIKVKAAKLGQSMTNFAKKLDAASICCQLVFVWVGYDGTIMVAGEKFVNSVQIPAFRFKQDGSKFTTGGKFSAFNGGDILFKGTYLRLPYEFTGGAAALAAFIAP